MSQDDNNIEQRRDEFAQRVTEMASRKVGYAAERNILPLLADLEAQRSAFADTLPADSLEMTIKLKVTAPRPQMAILEVTSVSWSPKIKRIDKDFEVGEVDLDQPELPGFNDRREVIDGNERRNLPYDHVPTGFDETAWYALLDFAIRKKLRICWFKPPRNIAEINREQKLCDHVMETAESAMDALGLAAHDKDTVVILNGMLVPQSVANLTELGANVYRLKPGLPSLVFDGTRFVLANGLPMTMDIASRYDLLTNVESVSESLLPWSN